MVLWDCITTLGLEEEEPTEEIQLSAVNITTRSQGPITNESLLPKIKKFQESMKRLANKTQNPLIPEKVLAKKKAPTVSKSIKVVENKSDNNKKNSVEPDMVYDIIKDIKKTKANVSLPQKRRKLLEALDPHPNRTQDNVPLDKELMKLALEESQNIRLIHFY